MPLANGLLSDALLVRLGWPECDHLKLRADAAASINRLARDFNAHFGRALFLTDAYRTLAVQVSLKRIKGKFAATPGTSNHGWGMAIDVASRVNIDSSDEHRWFEQNAPRYGWVNPTWASDSNPYNGQYEPWHWEYKPELDSKPEPPSTARNSNADSKERDTVFFARLKGRPEVWVGDGITRRHIKTPQELADLRWQYEALGRPFRDAGDCERIDWLGKEV